MQWKKEREQIVRAAKKIYRKGLVTGYSGNISTRLNEKLIAITPKSKSYSKLKASDIVIIDFDGNLVEGSNEPSSERMLHIEIYKNRKDVNAIIHTHSTFACTIAALNFSLPLILDEQIEILGGEIGVTKYAPSGTKELAEETVKTLAQKKAVLLSKHGAVGVGSTIEEAFLVCELLEKLCKIYVFMRSIGQ
ncbi:L-fuculose-phosphate aldolase [Thermodesulfovibrio aggregans]|uniref:L-fuculose-phosphate aldolase n=1 Tax=Thermodesulfovibrio aggregans TaxID=86166 RepID=A0A0U9HXA8_9BACT|nr:class II aldolase/adducin family protein [Thermodesulfovibrio aggregans]GAQ95215.1 L-fuculose-phosphate aldolase [Thermodesulfovibrio aggregans]